MTGQSIKALTFNAQESGKLLRTTLQKYVWKFVLGKVNHQLVVKASAFSRKINVILDGKIILKKELSSKQHFDHSFALEGNQLKIGHRGDKYQLKLNKVNLNCVQNSGMENRKLQLNSYLSANAQLENESSSVLQNHTKLDVPPLSSQSSSETQRKQNTPLSHQKVLNPYLNTAKALLDTQTPNKTVASALGIQNLSGLSKNPIGINLAQDGRNTVRSLYTNKIKLSLPEKRNQEVKLFDPNTFNTIQSIFSTPQLPNQTTENSLSESNDIFPNCTYSALEYFPATENEPVQISSNDSTSLPIIAIPLSGDKVLSEVNSNKTSPLNSNENKGASKIGFLGSENVEVQ